VAIRAAFSYDSPRVTAPVVMTRRVVPPHLHGLYRFPDRTHRAMRAVTVVGGGVSGLATAYYLSRAGIPVEIVEKSHRLGGLISTLQTPHGPVETAAIGMRNSPRVDAVCRDLGLPMLGSNRSFSCAGYIYRERPRRWPLSAGESLALVARYAGATARGARGPRPLETVEQWGDRVLGRRATRWLLGPALQGRYAGDPACLSASLLFGADVRQDRRRGKGVVAPAAGMQQLIDALERRLRSRDVNIRLNTTVRLDGSTPAIVCTSVRDAAEILRDVAPVASRALATIEMLPLVRLTAFYPDEETHQRGRGILFPRGGDIRALGVLFHTNLFPRRAGQYSESWIYGGAADGGILSLSDDELAALMDRDRERLCGRSVRPAMRLVHRWREALPHYDVQLESVRARGFDLPKGVFLVGNYVAGIGVPMLLEQAAAVAAKMGTAAVDPIS
jgi:oxygen-dependent protoporphyrinogen oxidase